MTSTASFRIVRFGAFAAAAIGVAAAAVLATAAAAGYNLLPRPATAPTASVTAKAGSGQAVCDDFLNHFSKDMNSSPAAVNEAFSKAVGQTLADEVANGTITQKQADALKAKLTAQPPCALAGAVAKPSAADKATIAAYQKVLLKAAADALGITPQELSADFAKGMSLSQIAAAQNPPVTEAQFRSRVIASLTPMLDTAVTNGQLTQAQEKAILKQLQTGAIPFWNTAPKMGKPAA